VETRPSGDGRSQKIKKIFAKKKKNSLSLLVGFNEAFEVDVG